MKRMTICMLIAVLGGIVAAQIPSTGPVTSQATAESNSQSPAPVATAPATNVSSPNPDTVPFASTQDFLTTTTIATTTTSPATTTVAATTNPQSATQLATTAPTTNPTTLAASGPSSQSSNDSYANSSRYSSRSRRERTNVPPPPPVSAGPVLTPRPMAREYNVLLQRSIFLKGRQSVYSMPSDGSGYRTLPATTTASTEPVNIYTPEANLVFNGVSDANDEWVAFIENIGLNTITRYHTGDAVAQGKIVAMTLDSIDYAVGPRVTHVLIGQNLLGVDTQVLTTQPVSATTNPSGLTSPGGADDVLERLRKRRLQELGGK